MPAVQIPHKLHFIWVGNPLPTQYMWNIMRWATQNHHYEVRIWTQRSTIEAIADVFIANKRMISFGHMLDDIVLVNTFDGIMVSFMGDAVSTFTITIEPIEKVPALSDPTILYEELTTWKNYGSVSDILRLWIIYHYGGIYFDMDTIPGRCPLPLQITAPNGYLLGTVISGGEYKLSTAVIASNARNEEIFYAIESLEKNYSEDYPKVHEIARIFPEKEKLRLQEVEKARGFIKEDTSFEAAQKTLHEQFRIHTTTRGSSIFREKANMTEEEFWLLSFQAQTKVELLINSDASWVK